MMQDWVGSPREDYLRLLQLTGAAQPTSWMVRPVDGQTRLTRADRSTNPWSASMHLPDSVLRAGKHVALYDLVERSVYNSAWPSGGNDGALWAGRGLSSAIDGGAELRLGLAHLTIAPTLLYSQNAGFALAPVTRPGFTLFANPDYPWGVDLPQRMGGSSVARLDPGQTALRVSALGVSLGASTENQWWGPGIYNSILMSNNAGGFPHLYVGSAHPINVGIGWASGVWEIGRLTSSGESTISPDTLGDRRWLNGAGVIFSPRFAPTLYVAAYRLFYKYLPPSGFGARDVLDLFQPLDKSGLNHGQNVLGDAADQMLNVAARWVFPNAGVELYGEWARNDHSWDMRDFILNPDHAAGLLVGLQKVFVNESGFVRVGVETIDLPTHAVGEIREVPIWYVHGEVVEGYTQRGQLIGAAIGPVGSAQYLTVDAFRPWGRIGGLLALVRHPDENLAAADGVPITPSLTLSASRIVSAFDLEGRLKIERQLNQYHQPKRDISNVGLVVRAVWRM